MKETVDSLGSGRLKIIQSKDGYRFSLDPVLLCAFSRVKKGEAAADLGTGAGVVPLLLAERTGAGRIVGVERQGALAELARRNVRLNGFADRVEIVEGDIRSWAGNFPGPPFDAVLTNPPYRTVGSGRQAPVGERAAARHELAGGLENFLSVAARLLRSGGRFYIVYLAERLAGLLAGMREVRLEPKRLRCVHSRTGEAARMVLVEGRRDGAAGMSVEAPLYIYEGSDYSEEVAAIYAETTGRL